MVGRLCLYKIFALQVVLLFEHSHILLILILLFVFMKLDLNVIRL